MPHLVLEHSSNIPNIPASEAVLRDLHDVMVRVGSVPESNCKSRIRKATRYLIAGGAPEDAFVHLEVRLLEGRSSEAKAKMGGELLSVLQSHFSTANSRLDLQLTVEIVDMSRDAYFKYPPGTLSPPDAISQP